MLFIAYYDRDPTGIGILIYRVVLALVAAGIGAVIPGTIDVNVQPAIRAGGAITFFVIVYWFNPPALVSHSPADRNRGAEDTRPNWPYQKTLEALKRKLDRISQPNAKILKAVAGADQYGIYADELSKATGLTRVELVYRGKELRNEGLIEMIELTDLNFRLDEEVTRVLGANPANFLTAYLK
jgi:hypothetical protein